MAAGRASWGARERILRAATTEFAAHGYAGATTTAIAKRAKVTQPLVHHHFGSKRALWGEVVAELFGQLQVVLDAALAEGEGDELGLRLGRILRRLITFSAARPELGRLIRAESSAGGEPYDALYSAHLEPMIHFFERLAALATKRGVFRGFDRGFAYFLLVGASTQLFAEPETARRAFGIDPSDPKVIARYGDFVVETLLAGFGPLAKSTTAKATRAKRRPKR